MEGIHLLRDLLLPADWMIKLDLKDAYLTVPMAPSSQVFLRFRWQDRIWQFTCLPFGLSSAPWCFTKLLKPVVSLLRSRGVRLIIYLDDMLLMSQDRELLCTHMDWTIRLLTELGFLLNWEKSLTVPSQCVEFLGFMIDSVHTSLSLPGAKIRNIRKEIRTILRRDISLRMLARVVGLLSSSIQAIFPAPLHYRALQRLKGLHLRNGLGFTDLISLSSDARKELLWWLKHLDAWNGRAIFGSAPDFVIESDASLLGWGARLGDVSTGGKWSPQETLLHINCLELLAGSFAIKSLLKNQVRCCVLLRMDNVSAVQYVNRLGGTKSRQLAELAKDLWHFCLDRDVTIMAEHLPDLSNTVADWNSRFLSDRGDWMLHNQLETGSGGPCYRCFFTGLDSGDLLRFSSVRHDFTYNLDDQASGGDSCPDNSLLAVTTLVSPSVGTCGGRTSSTSGFSLSPYQSYRRSSRSCDIGGTSIDGLVGFRPSSGSGSFLESARSLLAEAWAPGTRAVYSSAWSCWCRWCLERGLDSVSASPVEVVNFLSYLFDLGRAYRTINTYRSAISAGHSVVDGHPVGQHVLVCRLMRGIRFSRPPQSRYSDTWSVADVLRFLENWPPNELLSLKQLSAKLTVLLCLISFKRVSDVKALDLSNRSFTPSGVQFRLVRRTKTGLRVVSYPAFPAKPQLCVVRCLREYEIRTESLRNRIYSQLLISFRRPFLPVSAATLARWVRWIMQLAGVDVSLFGAHSSRGAMASMALQVGSRLEDILRAADWSRESTFREFYCKPITHVSNQVVQAL
ncbi:LOW QUALITY PROTEIN: uncharacterized protein WCC33_002647 [Rhinophrynus dorsalis]